MHVHCRLLEIMRERRMKVKDLSRLAGVGGDAIAALRGDDWQGVHRRVMGGICGALHIGLSDLFILTAEDIWAPIKLGGEVTIHYGSRSLPEAPQAADGAGESILTGQYVGVWDMRACKWISEYLRRSGLDVRVSLQEHGSSVERGYDPSVRESVRQIFERGNHVLIGSPVASQFTEEVVSHAYGVPPYAPQKREAFPYGFVWDSRRMVTSSFGWQGVGAEFGIWSTQAGNLVARRTMVKAGEGEDCALILVYRIWVPPVRRDDGGAKERVVICILGHSGAGTLAGARVATDSQYAAGLYPVTHGVPHMCVVRASYTRPPTQLMIDNREVTGAMLVTDAVAPTPMPDDRSNGMRRPRRKKPRRAAVAKRRKPNQIRRLVRGGIRHPHHAPVSIGLV